MKSLVTNRAKVKPRSYPCLMISTATHYVYLMFSNNSGTRVHSDDNAPLKYIHELNTNALVVFEGSITLEND